MPQVFLGLFLFVLVRENPHDDAYQKNFDIFKTFKRILTQRLWNEKAAEQLQIPSATP